MTRPLLSFVAITLNEAANFRKTLESVKPYIDWWTVVDTKSTDGTQALVRDVMDDKPGQLGEDTFVDFATTRNRALDADAACACYLLNRQPSEGKPSVFTLMLSGDERLEGGDKLREFLEEHRNDTDGAYCVMVQSGSRQWPYARVLRTDGGWRYKRPIHELPIGPNGEREAKLIPGVRVIHEPGSEDQERKKKRILEYDLPTLTKLVEDESKSLVDRTGDIFYLAETHANIAAFWPKPDGKRGEPGSAWLTHVLTAASLYWRHAELLGEDNEIAMRSLVLHYRMMSNAGVLSDTEVAQRMYSIVQAVPNMPEAHLQLAMHAARVDAKQGMMFALEAVRVSCENKSAMHLDCEWQALRIAAGCAQVLGRTEQARKLAKEAIAAGAQPEVMEEIFK